jgi:hypothetical protein
MVNIDDWEDSPEEPPEKPRDQEIDRATLSVLELIEANPQRVFYSTEIETRLERDHFHWITAKALLETSRTGRLQTIRREVQGKPVNFYAHKAYRYFRRELSEKIKLLDKIYRPDFTHAIGTTAELMFDSALSRQEFFIKAKNANTWQGRSWTQTGHNLDRIVVRDDVSYGVEIKNTQNYINRVELETKLRLCQHLELRPLFILRFAPKTYIHEVSRRGGFVLLFEHQIYPMGHGPLMLEVAQKLGIKVHSPRDIKEGDMQRLMKWHHKKLANR